ncbi:L-ascorbate metabolism protein UlaG (beta-lactamase superfamily) [Mesorhizobium soli]|uniref:MBL fold metallo-hydrolase n=1 Tax=Pseudaminobacter soli (ex Li et al. 2025) TaxID=1295366 RepID=UPI0024764253|nr:MBL fold metallo-hydrolase [Mesorhizobium soli]MDH6231433.1 L-ascorbate metabolism protein UlaG (beta-lactamase superfamily) [Mesorhizobium soli]
MARRPKPPNPYYRGPLSDHFDGRVFFNPNGKAPGSFSALLKWQFGGGRAKWPASWPSPFPRTTPARAVSDGDLRVTMVGHASLLVQIEGINILTDPVWSARVSPLPFAGPKRVNPPGISFDELPQIHIVLLSHNHYDHLDLATLKRLQAKHDPLVITPLGNDTIVRSRAPEMRIVTGDWGDRFEFDSIAVHIEPAHHWSARGTKDRRMALWSGFVVDSPSGKIYFAGDTGFHEGAHYRQMAEKHGGFRLAILPIGAYEPRWFMAPQHQNPDEAVRGMQLCNAAFAAGCHWGTFHLTNEPIDEPRAKLEQALDDQQIARERFRAMLAGEVWDVPKPARE